MAAVREKIILAACSLLEKQGFPAAGQEEIVEESGHLNLVLSSQPHLVFGMIYC